MTSSPDIFLRTKAPYTITSDRTKLDLAAINSAFASPSMWWCSALPLADLQTMLESSFCLGVYHGTDVETWRQIGLARVITDYTTMAYVTDVYITPEEQGKGLGKWLIQCVNEWADGLPHLRRLFLIGREGIGERFYRETLGTEPFEQGLNGSLMMAKKGPALRKRDVASVELGGEGQGDNTAKSMP